MQVIKIWGDGEGFDWAASAWGLNGACMIGANSTFRKLWTRLKGVDSFPASLLGSRLRPFKVHDLYLNYVHRGSQSPSYLIQLELSN